MQVGQTPEVKCHVGVMMVWELSLELWERVAGRTGARLQAMCGCQGPGSPASKGGGAIKLVPRCFDASSLDICWLP